MPEGVGAELTGSKKGKRTDRDRVETGSVVVVVVKDDKVLV